MKIFYTQKNTNIKNVVFMLIITFFCMSGHSFAQESQEKIIYIEKAYIKAFNEGIAEEFQEFFDADMIKRNPIKKLKNNLSEVATQVGNIDSLILDKIDGNSFMYRSVHEKMITLQVVFDLTDTGKITKMNMSSDYIYKNAPVLERNVSNLILPFKGEWYVFWGGKKMKDNYHNTYPSMRGASDFWVMGDNRKSHREGATENKDFYAFGKEIIAPAAGKIIYTLDNIADNKWPAMKPNLGTGNVVILETAHKEYILLGHLKQNSVKVKEGQFIKQGEVLGLCGNSGNSTEPHLHFQIQNLPYFVSSTGAWTHFKSIKVNGEIKDDYIPVRGDKIENVHSK